MTLHFRALAAKTAEDSAISANEILALRRAAWPDGKIDPEEAEAIFILNDQIVAPTAEWSDFFIEALVEFVVNTTEPRGYVTEGNARWLTERVTHNGKVDSLTELELLIRVLEKSLSTPETLRDFVLDQLEKAVLTVRAPPATVARSLRVWSQRRNARSFAARFSPAAAIVPPPSAGAKPKCCSGSRTRRSTPKTPPNGNACSCRAWVTTCRAGKAHRAFRASARLNWKAS